MRWMAAAATGLLTLAAMLTPGFALAASGEHFAHPSFHVKPNPGTGTPTGLSPAKIKAAYGFTTAADAGAGQTIAIVDAFNDPKIGRASCRERV